MPPDLGTGLQTPRPAPIAGMAADIARDETKIAGREASLAEQVAKTGAEREQVLAPMEQKMSGALAEPVPQRPHTELPTFKPEPVVDAKQYEELSYGLIAMAMIGGIASKGKWLEVSDALNGALGGYLKGNQEVAAKRYKDYETGFKTALAKEQQANREFEDVLKNRNIKIQDMISQYRVIAAKYDRQDALQAAQSRSIDGMWKALESRKTAMAKLEEQHYQTAERMGLQMEMHKDRMAAAAEARAARAGGGDPGKGWTLMKDKEGAVYRLNANAGITQKQAKGGGWQDVEDTPPDLMRIGARENQGRMFEEKAGMQYNTMKLAVKELDDLETKGTKDMPFLADITFDAHGAPSAAGRLGQKKALTDEQQQFVTAAQLFAEASGHLERGANLTDQQFQRVVREFIPQPGDKPGTLAMKKEHRYNLLEGGKIVSGEVGAKIDKGHFDKSKKPPPATKNAKGWELHTDASGNMAYVGPNQEIEEVK